MTTFLIITAAFFYIMAGSYLGRMMDEKLTCGRGRHSWEYCGHRYWNIIMPVIWPALAPIATGRLLYNHNSGLSKEARMEKKQQRELDREYHEAEKARIRALAAENLNRELRALGKDV